MNMQRGKTVTLVLVAGFVLTCTAAWAAWQENTKSHSSNQDNDSEGDIVGFCGFVDYYEYADSGKDWFGGEYECNNGGHSIGPGPEDKWGCNLDNHISVVWADSPDSEGVTFWSEIYHESAWFGQSTITEGATYSGYYNNRIQGHSLKVRFISGPSAQGLGPSTKVDFTLQGNCLVPAGETPRQRVSALYVYAEAGAFVCARSWFFTLISYGGKHTEPVDPSHFAVAAGTRINVVGEMSLWYEE